jgi:hypothetical protein
MQIPPLHPIFIQILSRLWFFTSFPEFKAAVFINTISTIGSLTIIYAVARKLIGGLATFLLLSVLIVHPHTLLGALNATPEPLLLFFVLISIYLWTQTRYKNMALVMASMSALVKIEGILLLAIFSLEVVWTELRPLLIHKKLATFLRKHWGIWTGAGMVLAWLIVATINNNQNEIPYGNRYLEELANRTKFFDWRYFYNVPYLLFFPINVIQDSIKLFSWPVLTTLFGLASITLSQRKKFIFYSTLFSWGYLIIHGFFPAHENRYYFPIIFLLIFGLFVSFMKLFSKQIIGKLILLSLTALVIGVYLKNENIASDVTSLKEYRAGYHEVAEWFKFQQPRSEKNTIIIAQEPIFIIAQMENGGYFDPNHDEVEWKDQYPIINNLGTRYLFLSLDQVSKLGCRSFTCVMTKFQDEFESLYVIYNHENFLYPQIYPHYGHYFKLTRNPFDQNCFVETAAYEQDWARIMRYDTEQCQNLLLQEKLMCLEPPPN